MPKKYDIVELIKKGEYKDAFTGRTFTLPAGSSGTIVEVYSPKGLPKAFEIEFKDSRGTEVVATVLASDVKAATSAPVKQNVVSLVEKLKPEKKLASKATKRTSSTKTVSRKNVRAKV